MKDQKAEPIEQMGRGWEAVDWAALDRMRTAFLDGSAGRTDYWRSERDLASYDATFAQRIGWKWDYVLNELSRRGWRPAGGPLLDWGCGSGIAGRAFVDHFGTAAISKINFWDRSPLAMAFAAGRARAKYAELGVAIGLAQEPSTILISHVLTELEPDAIASLTEWALERATALLWVEPGTFEASRRLVEVRERLRERMRVVAPCTHETVCGMLGPDNERHWCHHFASPPPEVFSDPHWGQFARMAGIDLRALPLSFLVLDKRPPPAMTEPMMRLIGRARVYKPHALLLACDASGVRDLQVTKRTLPECFRRLKKGEMDSLLICRCDGDEIISMRPPWSGVAPQP